MALASALVAMATPVACGGSSHDGSPISTDGGTDASNVTVDAATDGAKADNGAPSTTYPAFTVDVAQVVDNGGPVLAKPVIVTVTWSSDPNAATYNALGDAIGPSTYWHEINSEYGVGAAVSGIASGSSIDSGSGEAGASNDGGGANDDGGSALGDGGASGGSDGGTSSGGGSGVIITDTNHVSITTPPPAEGFSDAELDALVEAHAGVDWPAYTANTIYAIYLPQGSTLYMGGYPDAGGQDACAAGVGGYHTESQNKNYVYAILPYCTYPQATAAELLANVELGASHELNEASTDPHPSTNAAYVGFDSNHLAFEFFNQFQDELGDACESFATSSDSTDLAPYTVQRQWSNASAKAGSQWCLPKLAEPFYNTTFLPSSNLDDISVDLTAMFGQCGPQGCKATSKGFKMALNTTRTFPIGLFSDEATSGPFTLDIQGLVDPTTGAVMPIGQDQNGNNINNGTADITLDLTSGVNGQIANVTVKPTAYSSLGIIFFYVRAQLTGSQQHHYLPVLISQN